MVDFCLNFFRTEFRHVVIKNESDLHQLEDKITNLETEIATKESELVQERQVKEDLFHQASAVAQSQDSERKKTKILKTFQ